MRVNYSWRIYVLMILPRLTVFCCPWKLTRSQGGRVRDVSGDEEDGYDSTLIPVDFQRAGQIVDDDILKILVQPMRKGVTCTVLMDCCHSGTVLDLPYRFSADDNQMRLNPRNMKNILGKLDPGTVICCALLACTLLNALSDG